MRHVFTNNDVAANWAGQRVSHGRSHNGNFRFYGRLLYSYSTVIGNIEKAVDGSPVYLLTSNSYSTTTSGKHLGPAWRYTHHFTYQFHVPAVTPYGGRHQDNLKYLEMTYTKEINSARRSLEYMTADNQEWRKGWLRRRAEKIAAYCEAFGLEAPEIDVDADIANIIAYHAKRKEWSESPRGIKSREYGRKYREWLGLKNRVKERFGRRWDNSDQDILDNYNTEIGMMSWWTAHSGDPDDLAIIKWRFRNEQ